MVRVPSIINEMGYSEEEILHLSFDELFHSDDLKTLLSLIAGVSKTSKTIRQETRIHRKDGKLLWYEITGSFIVYEGVPSLSGTIINIDERKNKEAQINRLDRLHRFISLINESNLRSENVLAICSEACRIAVECGGFSMAWIGSYNEKTDKITPVAWNGQDEEYLKTKYIKDIKVSESMLPAARSIRNRSYFYCNDIANNPDIPWPIKDEMLKRNYLSVVSLPIIVANKITGTFVLYMAKTDFFNVDEIKLLSDVTGNIAYAVDKVWLAELHKKSEANLSAIFNTTEVGYLLLNKKYEIVVKPPVRFEIVVFNN